MEVEKYHQGYDPKEPKHEDQEMKNAGVDNSISETLKSTDQACSTLNWDDDDMDTDDSDNYGDGFLFETDDDDDDEYTKLQTLLDMLHLPSGVEASVHLPYLNASVTNEEDDEADIAIYQFGVVEDFSDHYYRNSGFQDQKPPSKWIEKVEQERQIMKDALPDMIYVRVYKSRMDLLRACIVGPQCTPYHDGLFVFDVLFPPNYPESAPLVHYYSGGLSLNPHLRSNGMVLLGGVADMLWDQDSSSVLEVLLGIQVSILNSRQVESNKHAEETFLLSLKTMIYILRTPLKHFEAIVMDHFCTYAHDILGACREYMDGALVGSLINGRVPDGAVAEKGGSSSFSEGVEELLDDLIDAFTCCCGALDCEKFRTGP